MNSLRFCLIFTQIIIFMILLSCDRRDANYEIKMVDNVKTYFNKKALNTESNIILGDALTINASEQDSLSFFGLSNPFIDMDAEENIYIFDKANYSIIKFDKNGNFIYRKGRKGNGPQEFTEPVGLVIKDTIIHALDGSFKLKKFDTNGNFINSTNIVSSNGLPMNIKKIAKGYVGYRVSMEVDNGKQYLISNLVVMNNSLVNQKIISTRKVVFDPTKPFNPFDLAAIFNVDKNSIFVAKKSSSVFFIQAYNDEGTNIYNITKPYRQLENSKEDIAIKNQLLNQSMQEKQLNMKVANKFKYAINNIMVDKEKRLWVEVPCKNKGERQFEIFKDGVFISSFRTDKFKAEEIIKIIKNNIITIDISNSIIRIFNY